MAVDTGTTTAQAAATGATPLVHNRTFDEIAVGDTASIERTLRAEDIQLFAALSGDSNPQHLDAAFAERSRFHGVIAHGMWSATLISAVLGTRLPGAGTVYLGQTLRFTAPVRIGDTVTVHLVVRERDERTRQLVLECRAVDQDGKTVVEGEARVIAPDERISQPAGALPQVRIEGGNPGAQRLLDHVRPLAAIRLAVVHPCNAISLSSALEARSAGLVEPVLVGPRARIEAIAHEHAIPLDGVRIEDAAHSHAAAARAAELAAAGEVEAIAKGSLHTDELMGALLPSTAGLRTKRRVSHCFLMQTPSYPRPFIITDAAITLAPTLEEKADIIRNAIDLAHFIGVPEPRVAILAAVETVNPRMPATLDAAALCKMADRGQISGGVLDGPLAFDNAVSIAAARVKGIASPVAGMADILVVPDLESGNMLAKQLEFLGDAESAGIVLGLRVPVVLTSRADPVDSRIASCALAVLIAHRYRSTPP